MTETASDSSAVASDAGESATQRGVLTAPVIQSGSLDDLARAFEPLAAKFFDHQRQMQQSALQYKDKELERSATFDERIALAEISQTRLLATAGGILVALVLVLAGMLIAKDQEAVAISLIQLVAAFGGASFGGYGIAVMRRRMREADDNSE